MTDTVEDKPVSLDDFKKRYQQLCTRRDEIENKIKPLRKQLADAQVIAENARVHCTTIAQQLYDARGGADWFRLKKEIGLLAKAIGGK